MASQSDGVARRPHADDSGDRVDAANNALAGRVVTWQSSDPSRATVVWPGVVTGVSAGNVTITAMVEGKSASSANRHSS